MDLDVKRIVQTELEWSIEDMYKATELQKLEEAFTNAKEQLEMLHTACLARISD